MNISSRGLLILVVALGGCAVENEPGAVFDEAAIDEGSEDEANIRYGDETSGYPSVGYLINENAGTACTGTLISSDVVLTAAHCVSGALSRELIFTNKASSPWTTSDFVRGSNLRVHPGYRETDVGAPVRETDGTVRVNMELRGPDLALVKLSKRFSNKSHPKLDGDGVQPAEAVRIVGYGQDEHGTEGSGRKRVGRMDVRTRASGPSATDGEWYQDSLMALESQATDQVSCPGDSGGPALSVQDGVTMVAGVASFISFAADGAGSVCARAEEAYYTSVHTFLPWIRAAKTAIAPPGSCVKNDDSKFATLAGGCRDQTSRKAWSRARVELSRSGARSYCANLVEGAKSDWRLPTKGELRGVASRGGGTHLRGVGSYCLWSTTTEDNKGVCVRVSDGVARQISTTEKRRTICVRGG